MSCFVIDTDLVAMAQAVGAYVYVTLTNGKVQTFRMDNREEAIEFIGHLARSMKAGHVNLLIRHETGKETEK